MSYKPKGMTSISPAYRILIRGIAIIYFILFVTALISSGYLLKGILGLKPVPMIGLLKYLLLCVLFIILGLNTLKVFSLSPQSITRFYRSTTNFKWLFSIAFGISVLAKMGIFNSALHQQAEVTDIQIAVLLLLGIFCFRSDRLLAKIVPFADQEESSE